MMSSRSKSSAPIRLCRPLLLALALWMGFVSSSIAEDEPTLATATFAGGCFWCMEPPYDKLDGVLDTRSGFSGGHVPNPSYEQVVRGGTGHLEVVQVTYDPNKVSYERLLEVFWRNIDPFQSNGQFCDLAETYRSAIFVHDDAQRRLAENSLAEIGARFPGQSIDTRIIEFDAFYAAEDYHQDYYQKNPGRYNFYRWRCGRDQRLEEIWGDEAGGDSSTRQ